MMNMIVKSSYNETVNAVLKILSWSGTGPLVINHSVKKLIVCQFSPLIDFFSISELPFSSNSGDDNQRENNIS